MVLCKSCGFENPDGSHFCQNCGGGLLPLAAARSSGDAPGATVLLRPDASWRCPECGHHNKPHATFCTVCGRDV